MSAAYEEILRPTSTNMWLIGLPIQGGCCVTFRFIFYFINLFLILIEQFLFIVSRMSADHFLEVTALVPCITNGIISQYKAFAMFLNRKRITKILVSIKMLYQDLSEEDFKIKEVERYLRMIQLTTTYYFLLNQVVVWMYNCIPLVLMAVAWWKSGVINLMLPFDGILPFAYDTWKPFILVYVHTVIGGFLVVFYFIRTCIHSSFRKILQKLTSTTTVLYLVAADTLFFVLTTHVCVHFAVICHKLAALTPATTNNLIEIVKRHQYLIELSQDMEDIFSSTLLLNYLASSVQICTILFNIVAGDMAYLPPFLLFITLVLVQIYLLSMFGDLLITESLRVGHAAYLCNWYTMERGTRTALIIIRERTRRQQTVTAMGFTPISYTSFAKIISTSWSYFTILNTVYSAPEAQYNGH